MNSISIGSAMVQYMSTPVNVNEAETFLTVFIALADAEKDVNLFICFSCNNKIFFLLFSFMVLQKLWNLNQNIIHLLLHVNR